jgi:TPR repeat protein
MYFPVFRNVESGKTSWHTLTAAEQKIVTEAKGIMTTAAKQGHAGSQYNLAFFIQEGGEDAQEHKEAARWYRKSAGQGLAEAQYKLEEAARWVRKAADQKLAAAQCYLGTFYRKGEGGAQDHNEAVRWFQRAVAQGNSNAQRNLGEMYTDGKGVLQGDKEAARWTRKAADQEDLVAQFSLIAVCVLQRQRSCPRQQGGGAVDSESSKPRT